MRLGINGFGRIGRQLFRIAWDDDDVTVTHVNDVTDAATLAHLLEYDSTYGVWSHEVSAEEEALIVDGTRISVSAERNPADLPWGERETAVVLESTGAFRTRDAAARHLEAGAERVLVSAPGKSPLDGDFVIGVNDGAFDPDRHRIISIGSCTTNCLAPVAKTLHDEYRIEHGLMTTVHAYTASQNLLDGPHKDLRRARSAAENIIPTSTGAAKAIGSVIPDLDGKLDGMALRVPVPCGSVVDLTCRTGEATTAEKVNDALRERAEGDMKGILDLARAPLVSRDVIGNPHSAVVVPGDTRVQGDRLVKVIAWYDNEWGFSNRLLDMLKRMEPAA